MRSWDWKDDDRLQGTSLSCWGQFMVRRIELRCPCQMSFARGAAVVAIEDSMRKVRIATLANAAKRFIAKVHAYA